MAGLNRDGILTLLTGATARLAVISQRIDPKQFGPARSEILAAQAALERAAASVKGTRPSAAPLPPVESVPAAPVEGPATDGVQQVEAAPAAPKPTPAAATKPK